MIDFRASGFANTVAQTGLSCSESGNVVDRSRDNRIVVRHLADRCIGHFLHFLRDLERLKAGAVAKFINNFMRKII